MSDFFNPPTEHRAQKPYVCVYCGERIATSEMYKKQTGVWDGEWFAGHYHLECFNDLCESGDYEFTPYSNERPKIVLAAQGSKTC